MVDFLLELGTEEIPAFYIGPACRDLTARVEAALDEAGLQAKEIRTAATPRRLTLFLAGLPDKQSDREEDRSGPPEKAAFDSDGNPTKAAIGFAKGQGVALEEIEIRDTPKGRYCFAHVKIEGRPTADVLAEMLPGVAAAIHFPKSMRWPGGPLVFARPIRSSAALLGSEVVPFRINAVKSGRAVHGHPFLAPESIELESADFDAYMDALGERFVIADPEKRRSLIRAGIEEVLKEHGSDLKEERLVDEVTNLVEFPAVVVGSFSERFLKLPPEVVKSAMMDHQRYFPVENAKGGLEPRFITVINRDPGRAEGIRDGNERVLAARLSDAEFFLAEDRKRKLIDRVDDLAGMVYQEKLGTNFDRMERLVKLSAFMARAMGLSDAEEEQCTRTARLCKVDLTTEMVGEFPNLQGIVGREYAAMDGEDSAVAAAIEEHYKPRQAGDSLPGSKIGKAVALAERFDAVTGCFAVGLVPTGSQDPYGLRRQALGIIRIVLEGGINLSLEAAFRSAASALPEALFEEEGKSAKDLEDRVLEFLHDRLYRFFVDKGFRYDLVKAALATGFDDIHALKKRLEALDGLAGEEDWEELVTVVQRTYNIFKNAEPPADVDPSRLEAPEEKELFRIFEERAPDITSLIEKGDFAGASKEYARSFVEPVHVFFDKVFVNVDDEGVKNNRLALMQKLNRLYTASIADLSLVVVETA